MREPTFLRPRVMPDEEVMRRLEELRDQVVPPEGATLIRDREPLRREEKPLPNLLRRQAG